jgi:hypothetical protein
VTQGLKVILLRVFEKENVGEEEVQKTMEKIITMYPGSVVVYMHCIMEFCHELFQLIEPVSNKPLSGERMWIGDCCVETAPIQSFIRNYGSKSLLVKFCRFCYGKSIDISKIIQKYAPRGLTVETIRYVRGKPSPDEELEIVIEKSYKFIAEIKIEASPATLTRPV